MPGVPESKCRSDARDSVFSYFKGILIFLQIYSIFYFLLLSIYIVPTVRRTIF